MPRADRPSRCMRQGNAVGSLLKGVATTVVTAESVAEDATEALRLELLRAASQPGVCPAARAWVVQLVEGDRRECAAVVNAPDVN
jgi:hypothetical protein